MKVWNGFYLRLAALTFVFGGLVCQSKLSAQSDGQTSQPQRNDPREFIQSSSPLGDGSLITSRTSAAGGSQTYIAQARFQPQIPTTGYQPRETWNQLQQNVAVGPGVTSPGYAYPRFAQLPTNTLGLEPIGSSRQMETTFQQTFMPPAQLNCPTCIPQAGMPPAAIVPPGAFPNQVAPQPIYPPMNQTQQPWLSSPGAVGGNRVNFTPLISLRNLPPGTYLGQGIIGQPKAYVDGEPVRNLFRYILP